MAPKMRRPGRADVARALRDTSLLWARSPDPDPPKENPQNAGERSGFSKGVELASRPNEYSTPTRATRKVRQ